jgi:hypothetical protein
MKLQFKRVFATLGMVGAFSIIVYDSSPHFDESLIQLKRDHRSAQRNWNIFYGQRFVYYDSDFRLQTDLAEIAKIIEPDSLALADLATSYYAASELPVYVRNVHQHHGRHTSISWAGILHSRSACYLALPEKYSQFQQFIADQQRVLKISGDIPFSYVLVNKDIRNLNLRYDCLWNGRTGLLANIERLAELKFEGEYLNLYELKTASLTAAAAESN